MVGQEQSSQGANISARPEGAAEEVCQAEGAARAKALRQESWLVERVERQAEEEGC